MTSLIHYNWVCYYLKILQGFVENFSEDFIKFCFVQEFAIYVFVLNKFYCSTLYMNIEIAATKKTLQKSAYLKY